MLPRGRLPLPVTREGHRPVAYGMVNAQDLRPLHAGVPKDAGQRADARPGSRWWQASSTPLLILGGAPPWSADAVWSAHADSRFALGRDEPVGAGDGRPDSLPHPHDAPRGPQLPGGARPEPGPDPVER